MIRWKVQRLHQKVRDFLSVSPRLQYGIPRLQFGPCFSGETGPKACTAPSEMHTVARITQGYATIQITSRAVRLAQ